MSARPVLAAIAGGLALAAWLLGEPAPPAGSAAERRLLADAIEREADHVDALQLAAWIRDRRPGLRVIDVRPDSEYAAYHVPTAERMSIAELVTRRFGRGETVVLYSEGGAHAAQAWVLVRQAGAREAYFLRGGILEWIDDVMQPATSTELTRWFGGTARAPGAVPMPDRPAESVRRLRRRSC